MKKFGIFFVLLLACTVVFAVPSMRVRRSVQLVDGTTVMATLHGDEFHSFLLTDDGCVLEASPTIASRYIRSSRTVKDELQQSQTARRRLAALAPWRIGSQANAPIASKGSPKIPVVLVNFTDSVFSVADTDEKINEYYDLFCNGTRDGVLYRGHGSYGSIRDYFVQQSDSLFLPEFVVIGPVTVPHPAGYYGSNSGSSKDTRYTQFRDDAIRAARKVYGDDWSAFDNSHKGRVDMVFLIYAGCGEANGGGEESIWPKESPSGVYMDGTLFATSACCNELADLGYDEPEPDGIGIMCHEFSHALGLPDLYNYDAFGMDIWSIMDYGCYCYNGYAPCAYTAYEREFMDWREIKVLEKPGEYVLTPLDMGGTAYKVINDENPNEYYILENRQRCGWDKNLCRFGHGMQVTHVDYSASLWNSNNVNGDANHLRMTIFAANNRYIGSSVAEEYSELLETWKGNLYPYVVDGEVKNDSLTSFSIPAATVYSAAGLMHKDINAIRENEDKTVTFYLGNDFQTAVSSLSAAPRSTVVRDLSGRPVADSRRRGLYIMDGKKVMK